MPIIVQPKSVITLSDFLESYKLTLLVRETGASTWEASFEPEVFEVSDEDDGDEEELTPVMTAGDSDLEAIQNLCEFLSGHDRLCKDDVDSPIELRYTKVECDHE